MAYYDIVFYDLSLPALNHTTLNDNITMNSFISSNKMPSIVWLCSVLLLCGLATCNSQQQPLSEDMVNTLFKAKFNITVNRLNITVKASPTMYVPVDIADVELSVAGNVTEYENESAMHTDVASLEELLSTRFNHAIETWDASPFFRIAKDDLMYRYYGFRRAAEDGWKPSKISKTDLFLATYLVRFHNMSALYDFNEELAALEHVRLDRVDWRLSDATRKATEESLRANAMEQMTAESLFYAQFVAFNNVRPLEIHELEFVDINAEEQSWSHDMFISGFKMYDNGTVERPALRIGAGLWGKFAAF